MDGFFHSQLVGPPQSLPIKHYYTAVSPEETSGARLGWNGE